MPIFGVDTYGTTTYAGDPGRSRSFPLLILEEAFTTLPLAEDPAWVDLGADDLRSFTYSQNNRSTEIDKPSAGSAAFAIDISENRALDPTNTASEYAPNVKPNRRLRFRAEIDGVIWPLWEGFVDAHNVRAEAVTHTQAYCDLTGTDAFKILQRAPLAGMPARPKERADVRVTAILDYVGWPMSRRQVSTARTILSAENLSNRSALQALLEIDDTECGRLTVSPAGELVFLSRRDIQTADRQAVSQATFSDSGDEGTIPYTVILQESSETLIRNIVQVSHPTQDTIVVEDTASRDEYGPLSYESELRDVAATARRATAEHFLSQFKDPQTRVLPIRVLTSDTPPGFESGLYAPMASLRVGDRVTLERTAAPGGGDPWTAELFIESKTDEAVQGEHTWFTTLGFSFAPEPRVGAGWDVSTWDHGKWGW